MAFYYLCNLHITSCLKLLSSNHCKERNQYTNKILYYLVVQKGKTHHFFHKKFHNYEILLYQIRSAYGHVTNQLFASSVPFSFYRRIDPKIGNVTFKEKNKRNCRMSFKDILMNTMFKLTIYGLKLVTQIRNLRS